MRRNRFSPLYLVAAGFLLVAAVLALSGCAPKAGKVTSTSATFNKPTKQYIYLVCIDDGQQSGCNTVDLAAYLHCRKGDQWPDCDHTTEH